jgi:hypothetical protein
MSPSIVAPSFSSHASSGPGAADMTQWRDAQARQFAATAPLSSFSSMLTVHYYTHRSTDPGISHEDFLEQKSVRKHWVVSHHACMGGHQKEMATWQHLTGAGLRCIEDPQHPHCRFTIPVRPDPDPIRSIWSTDGCVPGCGGRT